MLKKQTGSIRKSFISKYFGIISLFLICGFIVFVFFEKQSYDTTIQKKQIKFVDTKLSYSVDQRNKIAKLVMKQTQAGLDKQGIVSIPKVHVLLPVFNSAYTKKGLNAGANFANRNEYDPKGTKIPIMGKSNYGLAAHNFNDGKTAFSRLQQNTNKDEPYLVNRRPRINRWLSGEKIYLANGEGVFEYKIKYQELVEPEKVSVLNPTKSPQVTIVSCLYPSQQYRIITKGSLVKKFSWVTAPDSVIKAVDLIHQQTNAHVPWWNPGNEEGLNQKY